MSRLLGKYESMPALLHAAEARLIRRALEESDGNLERAAQLLGLKSHKTLSYILNGRHKGLRKPVKATRSDKGKPRSQPTEC